MIDRRAVFISSKITPLRQEEVTAAGFKLISRSDLLYRSADDHSKVVFDQSIRMKTDQFILKFRHP